MVSKLNAYEDRILKVLQFSIRELNTKEVAYYAKIDPATADKYLRTLSRKGLIIHKVTGNVNSWRIKGFFD